LQNLNIVLCLDLRSRFQLQTMSDHHLFRKQSSGASKRKAAKAKDERLSNDLKTTKCIMSFFTSPPPDCLPILPTPSVSEPGYLSQSANVDDDNETGLQHDVPDDTAPPPPPRSQEISDYEPGELGHGHQ